MKNIFLCLCKGFKIFTYNVAIVKKGVIIINLEALLKNLDKEKLTKMMNDPEFQEKAKSIDIKKLMEEIKKNPDFVNQLKKLF